MSNHNLPPAMQLALEANFGGLAAWRAQVAACASNSGAAPGWVHLLFNPREGTLVNQWVADPDLAPTTAAGTPLLALDLRERTSAEVAAANAVAAVDWSDVHARYQTAVLAASEACGADHDGVATSLVLDVRRAGVFEQASTQLPGAIWRDPVRVAQWGVALPHNTPITVYCVHGHEVSRATALRLRAAGLDARYLRGGIDGWIAAGRSVIARAPLA